MYKGTHGLIATDMFRMMRCQQVQRTSSTQAAFRLSPTHICGFRLYDPKVAICYDFKADEVRILDAYETEENIESDANSYFQACFPLPTEGTYAEKKRNTRNCFILSVLL